MASWRIMRNSTLVHTSCMNCRAATQLAMKVVCRAATQLAIKVVCSITAEISDQSKGERRISCAYFRSFASCEE